jgi:ribosomal protein S18 acetylase RimI-like enzyme
MPCTVRPIAPADRARWEELFAGYAAFYKVDQTPQMRATVWGWLMNPGHEVEGLVAVAGDSTLVGIAHFRAFARPLRAVTGGFLDDLFVDPAARGSGAARALIEAAGAIGQQRGWNVLRWITADDNYRARSLYDRVATRTPWITYDRTLG